jgi:hypothetical protein
MRERAGKDFSFVTKERGNFCRLFSWWFTKNRMGCCWEEIRSEFLQFKWEGVAG